VGEFAQGAEQDFTLELAVIDLLAAKGLLGIGRAAFAAALERRAAQQAIRRESRRMAAEGAVGFAEGSTPTAFADALIEGEARVATSRANARSAADLEASAAEGEGLRALKARVRQLGTDPATGFRSAEGIGGVRIERALGRRIQRSADEAADFVDEVLGPISLKGPIPAMGSAEGLAKAAIKDARFNTATNALFVDLRGLSSEAAAQVRSLVNAGTKGISKRITFLD